MKTIRLTQEKSALVDDGDFKELSKYSWCASYCRTTKSHIAKRTVSKDGKKHSIKMHRQIMGVTDPKVLIDHKNQDTLDNRRENLRICDHSQNQHNKKKKLNCSSKYKGVSWKGSYSKWQACIYVPNTEGSGRGKQKHLGYFEDEKDAALAYAYAALKCFKEFASFNF